MEQIYNQEYLEQLIKETEEYNQGWNPELELLVTDIKDKAWAYTWMHNTSVNYFSKLNDRLSVGNIGLNVLTGTSTFATLSTCSELLWAQATTGVFIYIAAFITGYQHYHHFQERIERHKFAASRYSTIYHNIQRELGLKPHQRQPSKDYITWITNQYDSLLLSSPELEDEILEKYHKSHSNGEQMISQFVKLPNNKLQVKPIDDYVPDKEPLPVEKLEQKKNSPKKSVNIIKADANLEETVSKKENNKRKTIKKFRKKPEEEEPVAPPEYFHQYDDNLLKYQLDRMNQATVDNINLHRMSRQIGLDPLDKINLLYSNSKKI